MHVVIIGAFLTHLVLNVLKTRGYFVLSEEMTLITIVIGGVSFYLARKMYMNVVLQTCSCFCGPGKCECTCGCREKCECFFRNKEEYYSEARRRGAGRWGA